MMGDNGRCTCRPLASLQLPCLLDSFGLFSRDRLCGKSDIDVEVYTVLECAVQATGCAKCDPVTPAFVDNRWNFGLFTHTI